MIESVSDVSCKSQRKAVDSRSLDSFDAAQDRYARDKFRGNDKSQDQLQNAANGWQKGGLTVQQSRMAVRYGVRVTSWVSISETVWKGPFVIPSEADPPRRRDGRVSAWRCLSAEESGLAARFNVHRLALQLAADGPAQQNWQLFMHFLRDKTPTQYELELTLFRRDHNEGIHDNLCRGTVRGSECPGKGSMV